VTRKNFTKEGISKELSKKTGYSFLFAKKLVKDLIEVLCFQVEKNNLNLKNIGSFNLIEKKSRIGRNPKTKEEFMIEKRRSISFKPSKNLIKNLNN
tara:strand:- start:329 stop:616 length:288 start_codon:yes stop_codon:yes gene_type:complete